MANESKDQPVLGHIDGLVNMEDFFGALPARSCC